LLRKLGADDASNKSSASYIWAHYSTEDRHYHNLDHICDCVQGVDWLEKNTGGRYVNMGWVKQLSTIELALWYHDLAYDPKSRLNEEVSIAVFRDHAREMHLDQPMVEEVATAIMATRHKAVPTTTIAKWVVDIDLSILAAKDEKFDDYERKIGSEFDWVPDDLYIAARTKVLQDFLDRDWVYATPTYRKLHEGAARANLKRSIARLARGDVLRMVR
jgi:predicted metal-dependent HD superfamily phosphohydrolase